MIYEVRKDFNRYLGNWIELVDTRVHPQDCQCVECKPRPPKVYRERDELSDKQERLYFK